MKPRLIDIAHRASVSSSTVSQVLRGKPVASKETQLRILQVAKELGYELGQNNKDLTKEITFVKIISHGNILNPDHFLFVNDYIDGIIGEASKHQYGVIVDSFDLRESSMHHVLTKLRAYNTSGIIILATELNPKNLKQFENLSVPYVFLDAYYDYLPYPFFDMNNTDSIFQILEYLKSNGHQKIGICSSVCESANYQRRRSDFKTCMEKLGLVEYDYNTFCMKEGKDNEYKKIKEALLTNRGNLPSALFCVSDALALTVLKGAKEIGIDIPNEMSLIGFDNLEVDEMVIPPLTSVDVPKRAIAQEATASLITMIESEEKQFPKKVLLSGTIIYRDSVATLKQEL
ncbi:MAG: substrate-binding domain-containing protein [Sphaerochaetaceae bacterium]